MLSVASLCQVSFCQSSWRHYRQVKWLEFLDFFSFFLKIDLFGFSYKSLSSHPFPRFEAKQKIFHFKNIPISWKPRSITFFVRPGKRTRDPFLFISSDFTTEPQNRRAHFAKCKQLLRYQIFLFLRDILC